MTTDGGKQTLADYVLVTNQNMTNINTKATPTNDADYNYHTKAVELVRLTIWRPKSNSKKPGVIQIKITMVMAQRIKAIF